MSREDRYGILIDAERNTEISSARADRGWERLQGSLRTGRSPLPVSSLPLSFGAVLFTTKAAAMAVALGATVAGVGWVYHAELGWFEPSESAPRAEAPSTGLGASRGSPIASRRTATAATSEVDSVPAGPEASAASPASRGAPKQAGSSLASSSGAPTELQLVGLARSDVDQGKYSSARRWLRDHARLYPQGVLAFEREALAVIAACGENRGASAPSTAAAYLRHYPRSIYQDRVRSACRLGATRNGSAPAPSVPRATEPDPQPASVANPPTQGSSPAPSEASFPALEP